MSSLLPPQLEVKGNAYIPVLYGDWTFAPPGAVIPKSYRFVPPKVGDRVFLIDVGGEFGAQCQVVKVREEPPNHWVLDLERVGAFTYRGDPWVDEVVEDHSRG